MKKIILIALIFIGVNAVAQNVGIGTPDPKNYAKLDIESTVSGLLLPRVTNAQRATLGSNISSLGATSSAEYNGLMIYDTQNNTLFMWDSNKTDYANGGWSNILDEDASIADADSDPSNEFQDLGSSTSGTNRTITITDGTNTSFSVADNDNDSSNEFQDLGSSSSGTNRTITITNGTNTTISVADNDNNSSNEIQSLSLADTDLTISGGNTVDVAQNMMSLSANLMSSPDDISGFTALTGDDATAAYNMPFSVTYGGTAYSTINISTNGWIEFTTGGFSDLSNDCLPTTAHSNPFIAAYWDDLVTNGNNIRYGTLGASPNRTAIIDYECRTFSGAFNVRFQVQIHEGSGLITVQYRDEMNAAANGQAATIGFQLNTSKAYPITCNGKVLDDNRDNENGWSIAPVY